MPSPLRAPTLGQGDTFSSASSWLLLPPCAPWHMEENSLSHLVGGAGPQDLQAKSVTLTVSNMLLQGHNSFQGK